MNDKIKNYITGFMIDKTPEEVEAVQPLLAQLVEDYGYSRDCIISHPQYRVKARPSDRRREYPVDIAVFCSPSKKDNELILIAECKQSNRKDGQDQLEELYEIISCKIWYMV